jgi:hypothetical protein
MAPWRHTERVVHGAEPEAMAGIQLSREPSKEFLDVQEFSEATGLSVATVRRYLRNGHVQFSQPAGPRGRILIPVSELTCLKAAPTPSTEAIERHHNTTQSQPLNHDKSSPERLPGPKPRWASTVESVL